MADRAAEALARAAVAARDPRAYVLVDVTAVLHREALRDAERIVGDVHHRAEGGDLRAGERGVVIVLRDLDAPRPVVHRARVDRPRA